MNKDLYSELFVDAPVGYLVCGFGGEIIGANTLSREMFLVEGDFPPGAILRDFVAAEHHALLNDYLAGLSGDAAPGSCAVSPASSSGARRFVRIHGRTVSGEGLPGTGMRLLLTLTDITREMQENRALRISEEKYWAMMNFGGDAIIIVDYEGFIIETNLKALALFGYPKKGFLGKHLDELYSRDKYPQYGHIFSEIMLRGTCSVSDIEVQTHGGRLVPVDVAGSVVEYGEKSLIQIIFRDITGKKEAENALRESEERYRKLVELSPDVIGIHVDGKIVFLNETGIMLGGFKSLEEAKDYPMISLIHPDDREKVVKRMERIMLSGEKLPPVSERIVNLKGEMLYSESNSVACDYMGRKAMLFYTRDITDKVKADDALRYSEETNRALLNATTDRIALLDTGWNVLAVNNATLIAGRVSAKELVGKNIFEILPRELAEARRVKLAEAVSTGKPLLITDNERGHVTVSSVYPIVSESGNVERLAIYARDITEQVNAERALRYSEETNRALLNATTDRIVLVDVEGRILALNNAVAESRGKSIDDLLGKNIFDLLPADVGRYRQEKVREVVKSASPLIFTDEESDKVIVSSLYPILDEKGEVKRIAAYARDITEQINTEAEKTRLLSEMNQIFSISTIGLCLIGSDCTILRANQTYHRMFGYEWNIAGRQCSDLMVGGPCINGRCLLKNQDRGGTSEYEVTAVRDGVECHLLVSETMFYNPRGIGIGILRSVADITTIRRLEKELIATTDRERQLIGQDLHDEIGQIMTGMSFMIEKLEKRMKKKNYPEVPMAAEINELNSGAISRMRDIIKGLAPVLLSGDDLMPALMQLADDTTRLYGAKVNFTREISAEGLDVGESTQIYYMIKEAVHNAIKHGSASRIDVEFSDSPGGYEVVVRNDSRAHGHRKRRPTGSMGLSIMKYRAEMIGAELTASPVEDGFQVIIKKTGLI